MDGRELKLSYGNTDSVTLTFKTVRERLSDLKHYLSQVDLIDFCVSSIISERSS